MINLGTPMCYKGGESGHSSVIGYESGYNRVVRFSFTTGSAGATSITITTTEGTIIHGDGERLTSIPFYITTSSTSHANANAKDGDAVTGYISGSDGRVYSGSASVVLKADTTYYLWFFPASKTYGWSYWNNNNTYYTEYETKGASKFSLTISEGTGSTITVNRTSSSVGLNTGNLASGVDIYKGDNLKITFTPKDNYAIKTGTVNGSTFTSGNTHTVTGNVSVVSTAQVLASDVGASDANIGSNSTITVTKYNSGYYHTLQYSFGKLSGYITSSGGTSQTAQKFSNSSVSFNIPESFYAEIPDDKQGLCTITCRTYSSSTSTSQLGDSTTCVFTVFASQESCKPTVSGSVIDINDTTVALTGDSSRLIRYKSTAQCRISATANNSSTILSRAINDVEITSDTYTINNVDSNLFVFSATDSRGYTSSVKVMPPMVRYIALTCNPIVYRTTPTGGKIALTISGNVYRDSFGVCSNKLTLKYRYKKSGDPSYGDWKTIASDKLTFGASSYRSTSEIELEPYTITNETGETVCPDFDYRHDYDFHIQAVDGTDEYILSTVDKYITVSRGIPVFDWGENDFNINVALMLNNINILNIIYPVGSVYVHSESTLPTIISDIGTWESVEAWVKGVYAWKRTG